MSFEFKMCFKLHHYILPYVCQYNFRVALLLFPKWLHLVLFTALPHKYINHDRNNNQRSQSNWTLYSTQRPGHLLTWTRVKVTVFSLNNSRLAFRASPWTTSQTLRSCSLTNVTWLGTLSPVRVSRVGAFWVTKRTYLVYKVCGK